MDDAISRQVLDLWNRYRPTIAVDAIEYDMELRRLLSTNLAEVGTDCISRQAALVAVKDALMAWSYMPEWRDEKILEAIAELPPAQPEQLEQCPIYGGMCAYPSNQCYDCPRHAGAKMEKEVAT